MSRESVLIIDTETTDLEGYPKDKVLEIGIAELKDGEVDEVYSSTVSYPDILQFCLEYERMYGPIWIFRNSDLRLEDIISRERDVSLVSQEVREIVKGRLVTAYNLKFDFCGFLSKEPWNLDCIIPYDIKLLATDRVYDLAYSDSVKDKVLQKRLLMEAERFPGKWIRSEDAYRVLCPDDPGRIGMRQRHRAIDDAVREGWILRALEK